MNLQLLLFVLFAVIGKSVGQLRCYACGFSSVDTDRSCLTITDDTNSVECPFSYCTIYRQELMDPIGVLASFSRGCEGTPDFLNHEVTDANFRTFYRACTTDLCNLGDGVQSVVGGNLSPTPEYSGLNLLVPGTGNAAIAVIGNSVGQLRCYACGFSSVDTDRSCLTITDDTNTVECPFSYCTIYRQEFMDPIGVLASFNRGCEETPDFLNHEVTDTNFRTFYRACTTDLCNLGDGVQSVVGGSLSSTSEYSGLNLLVLGTGSAASLKISTACNMGILLFLILNLVF